jgi:uncharacterized protein
VRAILDANVIISAVLSPSGTPAGILRLWLRGEFELVTSALLLAELERAFSCPKLRERIDQAEAKKLVEWLGREAVVLPDPEKAPAARSADPGDDYLLALAEGAHAVLVSGDRHLLELGDDLPVLTPRGFLAALERGC